MLWFYLIISEGKSCISSVVAIYTFTDIEWKRKIVSYISWSVENDIQNKIQKYLG